MLLVKLKVPGGISTKWAEEVPSASLKAPAVQRNGELREQGFQETLAVPPTSLLGPWVSEHMAPDLGVVGRRFHRDCAQHRAWCTLMTH